MARIAGQDLGTQAPSMVPEPKIGHKADAEAYLRGPKALIKKQRKQRDPARHVIRDRGGKQR